MAQLTQHCLYMDSAGYMKHNYMTQNLCTEQDKGKKATCVLLVQRWIKAYGKLLVVLYSEIWTHLLFWLLSSKPHSKSSNALDTLELHVTLLTPDLTRYSCIHACKLLKKVIYHVQGFRPNKRTLFFFLCLHSSTRTTKFDIAVSWTVQQWVNNATDPAIAAQFDWIEKPTKHFCTTSCMATIVTSFG